MSKHKCRTPVYCLPGQVGPQGPPGPISQFLYARARFVDPVNGRDSNNGASVNAPKKTITSALASITDNSADNRYVIILFPGGTVDPGTIVWKSFVSLHGWGQNVSEVSQDLSYTGETDEVAATDFTELLFLRTLTLDMTASQDVEVHVTDSRVTNLVWSGGGPFPAPFSNRLFLTSSTLDDTTIVSGAVFASNSDFQRLTLQDGDSAFLEAVGGFFRGPVVMTGRSQLLTRGVVNTASFTGTPTTFDTPVWETDSSSMIVKSFIPGSTLAPTLSGTIAVRGEDVIALTITAAQSPFTVSLETYIRVDATNGPVTVILPLSTRRATREIIVKKLDPGENTVTVTTQGVDVIDGAPSYLLTTRGAFVGVISHSIVASGEWDIIRQGS